MKSIKKNLTKTLSIITLITITFQSSVYAGKTKAQAYPLEKDLASFRLFKSEKESMQTLNKNIKIFLHTRDGKTRSLDQELQYPVKNLNGRTSLALKDVAQIFKLDIVWLSQHRLVQVEAGEKIFRFPLDKNIVAINNQLEPLNVPATVDQASGRSYLPARYLLGQLGYKVKFNAKAKTIDIYE